MNIQRSGIIPIKMMFESNLSLEAKGMFLTLEDFGMGEEISLSQLYNLLPDEPETIEKAIRELIKIGLVYEPLKAEKCKKCGTTLRPETNYCTHCGHKVTMTINCGLKKYTGKRIVIK